MRNFLAGVYYGFVWVLTLPPLWALYLGSRIIYLMMRFIPGYRKSVIYNNIRTSFPDIPEEDVFMLRKKYYIHLSQVIVESIKAMHWSTEKLKDRIILTNPEVLQLLARDNKNIIVLAGHTGNWEWLPALVAPYGFNLLGVYKPQTNAVFNELTIRMRKKKWVNPISMRETARAIKSSIRDELPKALLLIADQIPAKPDIHFWADFLGKETAFFTGGEKIARKYDIPVVFMNVIKTGRGRYAGTAIPVSENPATSKEGEITCQYIKALEKNIQIQPENWLWSHRRWKHQPEGLSLHECLK